MSQHITSESAATGPDLTHPDPPRPDPTGDGADPTEVRLTELRRRIRGGIHVPGDPAYPTAGFNVAVTRNPWAVVDVCDARDVADVVAVAGVTATTVAVAATGHGGTDVGDGSILVRTAALDRCEVDPVSATARVGAGVRWQTVIEQAARHGLAPLCGSAPGVGVAGLISGGGIGPLVRTFGATADHVRSIEVVTGDGMLARATPEDHTDLFWGLRGGKATLGLITECVIDLFPLSEIVGGALYFDAADAPEVLTAWQRWCADMPRSASTSLALLRLPDLPGVPRPLAGRATIAVRFACVEDLGTATNILAPMRAVATPLIDTVGMLPYPAIGAIHADPVEPIPSHDDGTLLSDLPDEALEVLLRHAGPDVRTPLLMVELRLLGGAYAEEPRVAGALSHRRASHNLHAVGVLAGPGAASVRTATDALLADMSAWACGRLPNFTASSDPAVIRSCYDDPTADRLARLAREFDPRGVLAVGQVMR
ncbi:FAD-binding oxidoreductase [Gordonia jinhuaensis]|uniref:FAD-linked oxidase n=1 Tax=Gordonia jinhuaensis TaxID=1517702 RepID=A0A916WRI7_9ACTN|nr:FAD-linked oxidase [Gordonia jinhuaensis]